MTNTITIDGRLTRDPELRFIPSGKAVANMTVAHNTQRYNRDTGQYEDGPTTFIDVTLWGKKAENIAEAATKGQVVQASGSLRQETWEDKQGGGKRSKHVINAETVAIVPTGQGQGHQQAQAQGWGQQTQPAQQHQGATWSNPAPTGQATGGQDDSEPPF